MEIRKDTLGGLPVVHIVGEVGRLSGTALRGALEEALLCSPPGLLVDFSDCPYLDGMALSILLGVRDRLAPGEYLVLVGASANLRHLFSLVGLDEANVVRLVTSLDEARNIAERLRRVKGAVP